MTKALPALRTLLGDRLSTADAICNLHGQNESWFADAPPDAVAFPETADEVAGIVRHCAEHGIPVTPYGAGSSLEGQHLPVAGGISVDFSRMNRVLAVQPEDMIAVVQPGVTRKQLETELRASGLFFPVDPGADASIGGMAATRASGTTAVRYGTMRDNVLAAEAVMADGTLIRTGTHAPKSSTGYDLMHLLVGSEGTLGLFTELSLRLRGQPEAVRAATCRFPSVEAAVNCVILTIQSGIPMARIELLDEMMVRGFNLYSRAGLPEVPHLFVEFHGSTAGVAEQAAAFDDIAAEFGATDTRIAARTEDRTSLWSMRHDAHHASAAIAPGKRTLATDICVPISRLAEAVTGAQDETRARNLPCTIVGHVGDGNFHCAVRFDPDDPEDRARVEAFTAYLSDMALRLGGTVSGEHGVGLGKQKYMAAEHGPALAYMRAVKAALDPQGILNPGKLLPPGNR